MPRHADADDSQRRCLQRHAYATPIFASITLADATPRCHVGNKMLLILCRADAFTILPAAAMLPCAGFAIRPCLFLHSFC